MVPATAVEQRRREGKKDWYQSLQKFMHPSPCPLPAPVRAKPVHSAGRGIKGEGPCALFMKNFALRFATGFRVTQSDPAETHCDRKKRRGLGRGHVKLCEVILAFEDHLIGGAFGSQGERRCPPRL